MRFIIQNLLQKSNFMKVHFLYILAAAVLLAACKSNVIDEADSPIEEADGVVIGDPGTDYDDVNVVSLEDKVAYSVGFDFSGEVNEFVNSPKFNAYFNRGRVRDGFFKGIEDADSVVAQQYNEYLMLYFQTPGSFDTTNLKPYDMSYYMGYNRGYELKRSLEKKKIFDVMPKSILKKGFKDGLYAKEPLVSTKEQNEVIQDFFSSVFERVGREFLAENKSKRGVVETKSGLQYEVVKAGSGPKPTLNSTVSVYYTLRDIDYRILETNGDQPEPISFPLNGVITGWQEGLQLMQKGGRYRLFVPYELGYGAQGAGEKIQPYSTLIFEIELVDFK
jgi:FKBP-type peptidyl-prolyl cis-trans isomerase